MLPKALEQSEQLLGLRPSLAIADLGYKGNTKIGETEILILKPKKKSMSQILST